MHFTSLFLLPLPHLILSHPVNVDQEIVTSRPIQNHDNSLLPIRASCVTVKTARSVSHDEATLRVNPHTTSPHRPLNISERTKLSRALSILKSFLILKSFTQRPTSSDCPQPQPKVLTRTLSLRDSKKLQSPTPSTIQLSAILET